MRPRVLRKVSILLICAFALSLVSVGSPTDSHAEDPIYPHLSITPFKIVLNAKLKAELQDIQAIINMSLESSLDSYKFRLVIEGDVDDVDFEANSFRYCLIDDNFLVSFDRWEIQEYLKLNEREGTLTVWVEGSYKDGPLPTTFTTDTDSIEVFAPGMK